MLRLATSRKPPERDGWRSRNLFCGHSGLDRQHKLIDSLPATDRWAAEAIQGDWSEFFAGDAVGTGLKADVGPPSPVESIDSDVETERMLDAVYGLDQPGLAGGPTNIGDEKGLFHQTQAIEDNKRQGIAGEDAEVARLRAIDPYAKIVRQIRVYVAGGPDYMVADVIFRGNGTAVVNITEVKTGNGVLTEKQLRVLGEAARTGDVYIKNAEAAKTMKIETHATFGAQKIIPQIYVSGGDSVRIERQLRNAGLDVRPAGVRGRIRIVGPPM
jgi:hypothetical protein